VIPNEDLIEKEFLHYLVLNILDEMAKHAHGIAMKHITKKKFEALTVRVPEISGQRRIVTRIKECMERVGEIEGLRAEVVAEANYLAPSLYAAIEDGSKWVRKKVGELIKSSRNGRSIKQDSLHANGHVLSLAAVHDVTLNLSARKPIVLPDDIATKYSISVGDVFVSRSNTRDLVGLASVANQALKRVIYPDLLIKLDPRQDLIRSRFLAYALRTPESRKQIKDRAVGTSQSMVKISGQRLKDVEVPVPPLDVQDVLIERFDELHGLASGLIGDLRFLNSFELRQSILRKAFAGEL
jgi:type I restriction enzyme S subunit